MALEEMDIEDLALAWPKEQRKCAERCSKVTLKPYNLSNNGKQWFNVTDLKAMFEVFATIGSVPYILVAGNTAHG